jgi:hypothetical protein
MPSTNEITGDALVSKSASDAYRSNWDLIFGKKPEVKPEVVVEKPTKFLIISNKGYCSICKDELRSYNRHDYKTCSCKGSAIDGGTAYQRSMGSLVDTSLVLEDHPDNLKLHHALIREEFCWGSRGVKCNQPLKYITLKDMTTDHIEAILRTQDHIKGAATFSFFMNELEYRAGGNCAV